MGFLDGSILVLTHPDAVRHVLHDNHANYIKGVLYDDVRWILGQGLVTNDDGNSWSRQRKLAQPAFRPSALDAYYPVMVETATAFLRELKSRVKPGCAVEISREMSRLTLRIIAQSVFKVDFAVNEDRFLQATTELLVRIPDPMARGRFVGRVYKYLPFWAKMRAVKARRVFEEGVSWIIENRRDPADLISYFAAGSTDAAGGSANRHIRDEVATFLLAGHETSGAGLTWTLYLLSQNPDAERRIRAEISEVLDHRPPSPADMPLLGYTGMVIQEGLRLYPPIPSIGRQAIQDDEIGGYRIRANTRVRIQTSRLHRRPDFWPDPDRFRPERFSAEESAGRPQGAYIPFGAGPRTCIGSHFAMTEMKLALVMILQAARLRLAQGHREGVVSNVTLRPRYGMWMIPEFSSGPD